MDDDTSEVVVGDVGGVRYSVVGFVNGFDGAADFEVSGRLTVAVSGAETFNSVVPVVGFGRA